MNKIRVNIDSVQSEFEKTAILINKNEIKSIINSHHASNVKVEFIFKMVYCIILFLMIRKIKD